MQTSLVQRLIPFSINPIPRLRYIEKTYGVEVSEIRQEEVPLRRCGRRVRKLSFQISGAHSWQALQALDNWLDALGFY